MAKQTVKITRTKRPARGLPERLCQKVVLKSAAPLAEGTNELRQHRNQKEAEKHTGPVRF